MSILPPKRKSKELGKIDCEGFRLLVESSRPEFWAVEEPEHTRRNEALKHELDIIEIFFHRVAGTRIPEKLMKYPQAWWGEKMVEKTIEVEVYYLNWGKAEEKLGQEAITDWDHTALIEELKISGVDRMWDKLYETYLPDEGQTAEDVAETIFARFNNDTENPLTEFNNQNWIAELGSHTSMSARDVLIIRKDGKIWAKMLAKNLGWEML